MTHDRTFEIQSPPVVHETIDGETLIINLQSGSYYTLDGPGALAWDALALGGSRQALIDALTPVVDSDLLIVAIDLLLEELVAEGLVRETSTGASDPPTASSASSRPIADLALRRYDELQELLLIDPIHEVQDSGWPQQLKAS